MVHAGLNQGIIRLLIGKSEAEAIEALEGFKCKWRVYAVDGSVAGASSDRDDRRYNLILNDGVVTRVIAG